MRQMRPHCNGNNAKSVRSHAQLSLTLVVCVCVCVCVLCAAGRLQSDAAFGKPSLRPVELPKPPVLPLLQHADDVTL